MKPPPHEDPQDVLSSATSTCPPWCVTHHGVHLGEEDWIHTGAPVMIADGLAARLCVTVHPVTGATDGPYVLIGECELTLSETAALGDALVALAAGSPLLSRP